MQCTGVPLVWKSENIWSTRKRPTSLLFSFDVKTISILIISLAALFIKTEMFVHPEWSKLRISILITK